MFPPVYQVIHRSRLRNPFKPLELKQHRSMITREKTVKEFEIVFEAMPQHPFTVRAESVEKAHRLLTAQLRAVIAEIASHKNKGLHECPDLRSLWR